MNETCEKIIKLDLFSTYFKIDLTPTNIISGTCSVNKAHRIDGNKEFILE